MPIQAQEHQQQRDTDMPIFKLDKRDDHIENGILIPAKKTSIELESHLEAWLENSPWAITQEPLLIIGRQTPALQEESKTIFPDLIGIDKNGNLVIIELKKGKTPRDVVAQLLEYAAWANELSEESIRDIASDYFAKISAKEDMDTQFRETFELDETPPLNRTLRLFIAAEEIDPSVAKVSRFLRQVHSVDINCIKFSIYQTESGEILVSSEPYVGLEEMVSQKKPSSPQRWSGDKTVSQVVWEAVLEFTNQDKTKTFSPKEITQIILNKYPTFNKGSINCQLIADCVNHTSRHHYSGGKNRYWWIQEGKYRLYDPDRDTDESVQQPKIM